MKKLLLLILPFLFVGCGEVSSTPTKKVEAFFASYQTLEEDVISDLDKLVDNETKFNDEQKRVYKELMKNHYQDLKYEIKDEIVDGDEATVVVEIEVKDYSKILDEAESYLNNNQDDFKNSDGSYDESLFTTYRLNEMQKVDETVKYTLDIYLTKIDTEWRINDLSNTDLMKIQGIYNY